MLIHLKAGVYLPLDSEGYLVNDCPLVLQPLWRVVVKEIAASYQEYLQERLHSAYVRGSVARGTARMHFSDVDTFAILRGPGLRADREWQRATASRIRARYDYVQGIELGLITARELEVGHGRRLLFFLKTQGRCIAGTDLSSMIPRFKPSLDIAVQLPRLQKSIERASVELQCANDVVTVQQICQWITKILVRSGFELIMEQEKAYTRDLTACVERFARHYPMRAQSMRQALDMAVYPTSSPAEVLALLADLGTWLIRESAALAQLETRKGLKASAFYEALREVLMKR
jgi:hypothetical protein